MITFKQLGRIGRFGNQAFQVAGTIGLAIKNNHPYCFPVWKNWDHLERFGSTEDIDIHLHLVNPLPEFRDVPYQHVWVDWGYRDIKFPNGKLFDLGGHLQSPKYFDHCMPLIRHTFKMKDEPEQNDFTAIHFRAGDYTEGAHTYHPRQAASYYKAAMEKCAGPYLIFSDDKAEAKKVIGGSYAFAEGGDYLTDFKLMKKCKNFIVANSSFSMFAAILGEDPKKVIVAPKLWFGEAAGGLDASDIYPENTIII